MFRAGKSKEDQKLRREEEDADANRQATKGQGQRADQGGEASQGAQGGQDKAQYRVSRFKVFDEIIGRCFVP